MNSKKYFTSLNILKGLACIGVIFQHCGFPGITGKVVAYLFKFDVPIFFMIAGYFLYSESYEAIKNKLKRRIPHIGKLLLFAFVFYGLLSVIKEVVMGDIGISKWFAAHFVTISTIYKIFLGTFFCGPMWYLYAQLWAYVCLYFCCRRNILKYTLIIAPVFLVIHIVLRTYIKALGVEAYSACWFRNFLMYAIPFIITGFLIAKHQKALLNILTDKLLIAAALVGGGNSVFGVLDIQAVT